MWGEGVCVCEVFCAWHEVFTNYCMHTLLAEQHIHVNLNSSCISKKLSRGGLSKVYQKVDIKGWNSIYIVANETMEREKPNCPTYVYT